MRCAECGQEGTHAFNCSKYTFPSGEFTVRNRPNPPSGVDERMGNISFPNIAYKPGPEIPESAEPEVSHFQNFIDCVRSRKQPNASSEQGHASALLSHLANISFRVGNKKLAFNAKSETFVGAPEANQHLRRTYRAPWAIPDQV